MKGTADIHAVYHGHHPSTEVKIDKDQQSVQQKQTKEGVNKAGGYYYITKDFQSFNEWITGLTEKGAQTTRLLFIVLPPTHENDNDG